MKDKTPVLAVSEIIKMLELLSLFDKKDDIEKIQKVIRDMITSLEKQARGVNSNV